MSVLVDGNNLLHEARQPEDMERLIDEAVLCETLATWASRVNTLVQIVFDGPPAVPERSVEANSDHLEVRFSGHGRTADELIVELLCANSAARDVLVVSSDRGVQRAAKRRRAGTIRSREFWERVRSALSRTPRRQEEPRAKREGLRAEAADEWLRLFRLEEEG
jgi:predicted RNA-binding protein with PIN domain